MAPTNDISAVGTYREEAVLTRRQVEGMIADGKTIIILDGKVLKVDSWLKYHPGGDKSIMHVVGRDATDEVNAYGNRLAQSIANDADTSFIIVYTLPMLVNEWLLIRLDGLKEDGRISYLQFKAACSDLIATKSNSSNGPLSFPKAIEIPRARAPHCRIRPSSILPIGQVI